MKTTSLKHSVLAIGVALFLGSGVAMAADSGSVSGEEVIKRCLYKNAGHDQRSKLTITLTDQDGNVKKNVYKRYWKNYQGKDGILDKMLLFTQYPPDAKGTAFMRWSYVREAGKNADQWLYLPVLRKIRRVSVRDPGDSFLGSDLTYADISPRGVHEDTHRIADAATIDGKEYYVIESLPKEQTPLYSKRISWFTKTSDWKDCTLERIDYYAKKGDLLKRQHLTWQRFGDIWVWKKVVVENMQTLHSSIFEMGAVEVEVGLKDRVFTERQLRRGVK